MSELSLGESGALIRATTEAHAECLRAHAKHGDNSMVSPQLADAERLPILGEEFGEVCRGMTYDNNEGIAHLREELIQTAAMAISWAAVLGLRIKEGEA